jgi:putative colanic acid biosynthesis UDP-glucose lipid carrier transferase
MYQIHREKVQFYAKARLHSVKSGLTQRDKSRMAAKRTFDVIVSLLVITTLLSWLLPVLALIVKLSSKGPVFFIQKRTGLNGKPFHCLKLRTMVVNKEANTRQAQEGDPRITRVGKFLRLSCLDELPQFFNVLVGDMSVVGPRPHMIRDCKEFSGVIPNYDARNLMKPGITGMAQVKGFRGETVDYFDIFHRYKWDMFYIRNASFNLDMRIIRLTISSTLEAVIRHKVNKVTAETKVDYSFDSSSIHTPELLN